MTDYWRPEDLDGDHADVDEIAFGPATRARWDAERRHALAQAEAVELEISEADPSTVGEAHLAKLTRRLATWHQVAAEYSRYLAGELTTEADASLF